MQIRKAWAIVVKEVPMIEARLSNDMLKPHLGPVLWEQPFLTGEANMSHTLANLEHHHFKYGVFCRPGDTHVHFFGATTLSFSEGIETLEGEVFEIEADAFSLPARNPLVGPQRLAAVRAL